MDPDLLTGQITTSSTMVVVTQPQLNKVYAYDILINNMRTNRYNQFMVLRLKDIEQLFETSKNDKNKGDFIRVASNGQTTMDSQPSYLVTYW